jgi:Rrf2 family transcriptional regulator, iron-sulfur cluster assembly transcription factor
MKLSTKGRYAMIALADMARRVPDADSGQLVSLGGVAERQDISLAYLEQLFVKLRRAGIVESGARPGRRLPPRPSHGEIRVSRSGRGGRDHGRAVAGAGAHGATGGTEAQKLTDRLWESLGAHVYVFLHQTRLCDVVRGVLAPCPAVPAFVMVDEG